MHSLHALLAVACIRLTAGHVPGQGAAHEDTEFSTFDVTCGGLRET